MLRAEAPLVYPGAAMFQRSVVMRCEDADRDLGFKARQQEFKHCCFHLSALGSLLESVCSSFSLSAK